MQQAASVNGPDKAGYGFSFLAIGEVLMKMNKLDSVPYYLQRANLIFSKRSAKTQVMAKYGDMEMMRGNYPLALDYYRKSLHLAQRNNEPRTSANIQNALSKFYKTTNQRDSAIAHAKRGLAEADFLEKNDLTIGPATVGIV
jgi:tetratricopeptide (TPR) repeat protein